MDRKVIIAKYVKAVYRDLNKVIMCLVSLKNLCKSRRINDKTLFSRIINYNSEINESLASAINNVGILTNWAICGLKILSPESVKPITEGEFSFFTRKGDNPDKEVKINRESIISVEKHYSGGALIRYNDGEEKEIITFEKFNEVVVQLGFEVEYKNGRYVTKEKSSKSIKISELKEKLDEILENNGDIELEATFSVVRGDDDYKIRSTGDIEKTVEFCKQKIERPTTSNISEAAKNLFDRFHSDIFVDNLGVAPAIDNWVELGDIVPDIIPEDTNIQLNPVNPVMEVDNRIRRRQIRHLQ